MGADEKVVNPVDEDANGVRFLVEMQNWSQRYFNKRAVYYSTYAIQDQALSEKVHQLEILEKDEWDYNYAQVYLACFLNFNMRKKASSLQKVKEDEYLSIYRYRDLELIAMATGLSVDEIQNL